MAHVEILSLWILLENCSSYQPYSVLKCHVVTMYINTRSKEIVNSLSRFQFGRFSLLAPEADVSMTNPIIWL